MRVNRYPVRSVVAAIAVVSGAWGCSDSRERPTVPEFGQLGVTSDPRGATIFVDGSNLGAVTPDTLSGIAAGRHLLSLRLEAQSQEVFTFDDSIRVPGNDIVTVDAALEGGCGRDCPFRVDGGRILCRFNNNGDTCAGAFFSSTPALQWPGGKGDFAAGGRLIVASIFGEGALSSEGDTTSTQFFRQAWVGRRPVRQRVRGDAQVTELDYWATALFPAASLLGLSVNQRMVAVDSAGVEDVIFIRFEIENVSDDDRYRNSRQFLPDGGFTFTRIYLGFGLDADIGDARDDLATFDLDNDLAFMYDADFRDGQLEERADSPPLVGLAAVEPPPASTERTFTAWRSEDDWDDGSRHDFAWRLLSGRLAGSDPIADHPAPDIGFHPSDPDDLRIAIAYGPLQLAPGESTTLTLALLLADPVPGTFTPGQVVPTGDPLSSGRQILAVADDLRRLAARLPELWTRYSSP